MTCVSSRSLWYPLVVPIFAGENQSSVVSARERWLVPPEAVRPKLRLRRHLAIQLESWRDERCPPSSMCFWSGQVSVNMIVWFRRHRRDPWVVLDRLRLGDVTGQGSAIDRGNQRRLSYRGKQLYVKGGHGDDKRTTLPDTVRGGERFSFPFSFDICAGKTSTHVGGGHTPSLSQARRSKRAAGNDSDRSRRRQYFSADHHETAPKQRGSGHRFLKPNNPLTERQRKYCDCLLLVKAKHSTRNPFGPCRASIRPEPGTYRCQDHYDLSRIHGDYLAALRTTRAYDARRQKSYPGM